MSGELSSPPRPAILGMLVDHSRFLHRKASKHVEYPSAHQSFSSNASTRRTRTPRLNNSPTRRHKTPDATTTTTTNSTTTNSTTYLRSRLFTSFLNLVNQTPYTYIPQGHVALQLHTEYDASSYALPRKEKHVAGPLVVAFLFYAKVLDPRVATGKYYPTFEDIDRAAKTMTFTELLAFCWDFNIVPQLISRGDLKYIFGQVQRARNEKLTELTFHQFEELLTRVALVAFYPLTNGDIKRIGRSTMRKLREHIEGKRIRLKDVFRRFDTSGDGILSRDEFMAGLRDICGSAIKQRDLEAVYSLVDEDGGGEVEFIEFITAMNAAAPPAFANTTKAKSSEDRYKVPEMERMRKHEASDSDSEEGGGEKEGKTATANGADTPYKKCLHDYLCPSEEEEETGTLLFPGGRNLSPSARIRALMRSMGRLTVSNIRRVIDTRGRVTAGKMNGSIKSQETEFSVDHDNDEIANEVHTARILRKRDGTMCDYSAPLLMKRRAASTTDYRSDLTTMWEKLRRVNRTDDWRSYHSPCGIYLGPILINSTHLYRIVVRNPLPFSITIEVTIERFPHTKVRFNRQPVASGMTTDIYIDTKIQRAMEALGTVTIAWREWKREVVARKYNTRRIENVDVGTCTVYLYGIAYDPNHYGAKHAEEKCPAMDFKIACNGEPCPRNYLAFEHPAHRYSIPGSDVIALSPTRKGSTGTLPRKGTARMLLRHLPTGKDEGNATHRTRLDAGSSSFVESNSVEERKKRGILLHQWAATKQKRGDGGDGGGDTMEGKGAE